MTTLIGEIAQRSNAGTFAPPTQKHPPRGGRLQGDLLRVSLETHYRDWGFTVRCTPHVGGLVILEVTDMPDPVHFDASFDRLVRATGAIGYGLVGPLEMRPRRGVLYTTVAIPTEGSDG